MRPIPSAVDWLSALPWGPAGRLARRAARGLLVGAAHTGVWLARMLSRHRAPVAALLVRVMWLAALVLLVEAGRSVFDVTAALNTDATLTDFFTGLGLCAATVALAQARRIRWAAIALGTVHGGLALLLWSAAAAT